MDELLAQFETTDINPENDQKTLFDGLYKNWGKKGNQELRRKNLLDSQKRSRNTNLDTSRGIVDIISTLETSDKRVQYRPQIHVAGFTRASVSYKDILMKSEWMIEKPLDFESNWLVVPCPVGVRVLAVAYQGNTRFYTKFGSHRMSCHTALPGGNPFESTYKNQCVVLDCFHVESLNKMFILDVLAWRSQPMTDGEAEFRHYWLQCHIEEIPELFTITSKNKILFEMLPKIPCDKDSFNKFMMKVPYFEQDTPKVDGLLFYHKNAHYISGETPLVGWLYPFMVNEILGPEITVSPLYMQDAPIDYVNQEDYIRKFDEMVRQKKSQKHHSKANQKMDASDIE